MFYTILLLLIFSVILLIFDHKSRYSCLFVLMAVGAMIAFFFIILHINMFASYGSYGRNGLYYELDYSIFRAITSRITIPIVTNIRMMNLGISLYLLAITIFNFDFNKNLLKGRNPEKREKTGRFRLLLFLVPIISMALPDPWVSTNMYLAYHTSRQPQIIYGIIRATEIGYKLFVLFLLLRPVLILFKYVAGTKISFLKKRISLFAAGLLLANGIFYFFFCVGTFSISSEKVRRSGFWIFENIEAKVPDVYLAGSSLIFVVIAFCMSILLSFNMDMSVTLFARKKIQKNVAIMNEVLGETLHSQKNLFFSMQILIQKIHKKTEGQDIPEVQRMEKLILDSLGRTTELLDGLKEVRYHYLNNNILDIVEGAVTEVNFPEEIELYWDRSIYGESKKFFGMYDKYHLEKALVNILNNAVEAIEQTGREDGKIRISLSFVLNWLVLEIQDNGTGIRRAERKQIFSPHYSGKHGKMNWGLGLPYVYKVIKAHLGQIKIDSRYGRYTTVLIMLPTGKGRKYSVMDGGKEIWAESK